MAVVSSPNMNLPVPTVGTEQSPAWANDINACLSAIDSHNHTSGQGVQIPTAGIGIDADLAFNGYNATVLRSVRLSTQPSALSLASDIDCLYSVGSNGELYYNDNLGNQVQITSGGSVNATSSGISNPPASAAFVSGILTVLSSGTTRAAIDAGAYVLRYSGGYPTPAGNAIILEAPAALSGVYPLVFPPALPGSQKFMTLDASGNIAAPWAVDNSTIVISANTVKIPSNVNLPGNAVQVSGKNIVVQNANTSDNLAVVRGYVNSGAAILGGEGFSVSTSSVGVYNVTFTPQFSSIPIVVATIGPTITGPPPNFGTCQIVNPSFSGVTIKTFNQNVTLVNADFLFIAMGPT